MALEFFLTQFEAGESISEVPSIIKVILPSFTICHNLFNMPEKVARRVHGKLYSDDGKVYF